ncbi:hypothetical protein KBB42_01985 [Candidatus Dojkabacteria bacterium]|nr:hypothetical protein [Candidatus Dojkabacteria bacterium]
MSGTKNEIKKTISKERIDFYGVNWIEHISVIYLAGSRNDFDIISGYKTDDWVVGSTLSYNKRLLLSPGSYESVYLFYYCP